MCCGADGCTGSGEKRSSFPLGIVAALTMSAAAGASQTDSEVLGDASLVLSWRLAKN
jgi:hypothetical protein